MTENPLASLQRLFRQYRSGLMVFTAPAGGRSTKCPRCDQRAEVKPSLVMGDLVVVEHFLDATYCTGSHVVLEKYFLTNGMMAFIKQEFVDMVSCKPNEVQAHQYVRWIGCWAPGKTFHYWHKASRRWMKSEWTDPNTNPTLKDLDDMIQGGK